MHIKNLRILMRFCHSKKNNTMKNKNSLLFFALLILLAMVSFRIVYSHKLYYLFLIWNTFLATLPYALSELMAKNTFAKLPNVFIATACILFLPNALYLISDFEHLAERPPVPFFYDILLMFYTALLGLLFNILALRNLHRVSLRYWKPPATNRLIALVIFLSGFGVYLGRYLRWNSWDLITNPRALFYDCVYHAVHPSLFVYTWSVSFGYAFVLGFGYLFFIKSMQHDSWFFDSSFGCSGMCYFLSAPNAAVPRF